MLSLNGMAQQWTLEQCLDSARIHNRSLLMGANDVKIAISKNLEAQQARNPKVVFNGDYKYYVNQPTQLLPLSIFGGPEGQFRDAQFGVPHNLTASVQAVMPLYDAQTKGAIRTTDIAQQLSNLNVQKTEEQLIIDVSTLYYNALVIQHQHTFLDSNILSSQALLGTIKLLHEQLLATGTDVGKVELQLSQLESNRAALDANYAKVLDLLRLSMGIDLDTPFDVVHELDNRTPTFTGSSLTIDQQLVGVRQNLLGSELQLLKDSRKQPSISLVGAIGALGYGYDKKPNGFLDFYPLTFAGVSVKYPIFNGMVTQTKIEQKELEINGVQIQAELLDEKISQERRAADRAAIVAQQSILDSEKQIELARRIYDEVLLQQKHGLAGLTEILLADNALREARQNNINALIDLLRSDLEIQRINGQLMTPTNPSTNE